MKLLRRDCDFEFLNSEFRDIEFLMYRSDDSLSYISCIVCLCSRAADIVASWRVIQNLISVHYQPQGNLASWNVYIAYMTNGKVPIWDKYQIENDKYMARKIIIDGLPSIPIHEQVGAYLDEHLLGSDLTLDPRVNESREALLSLEEFVRGAPTDQKVESKEKRASMIKNIIELLSKNENQKS